MRHDVTREGALKMPFIVDTSATFNSMICMGVIPREVFGRPGEQERNAAGILKWTAGIAVSYHPDPAGGMTPPSEVINVTIVSNEDPGTSCPPGTAIVLDGLRAGVSSPEARQDGRIRGGKLFWSAAGIRPAQSWSKKSDAA